MKKCPKVQLIQILRSLCQQKSVLPFSNNICIISHKAEHRAALLQESRRSSVSEWWQSQAQKMLIHSQCCNSKTHQKLDLLKQHWRLTPSRALPFPFWRMTLDFSVWCCRSWFWWEWTKRRRVLPEYRKGECAGGKWGTGQKDAWDRLLKDKFRKKWLLVGRLKRSSSRYRCESKREDMREGWEEGRSGWKKPKQGLLRRLTAWTMRGKGLFDFDLVNEYVTKKEMHGLIVCRGRGLKMKHGADVWSRWEATTRLLMGPTEMELETEGWL